MRGGVTPVRVVLVAILATALGLGALMWWLQTRAYYREAWTAESGFVQVAGPDGTVTPVPVTEAEAIDSDSSPIRYRACFTLAEPRALDALAPYDGPTPLIAPGWFDCFDARAIGEALEAGEARAFLARPAVALPYGVDRVLAAFPDGRGYLWQQLNPCGEAVYDGRPPPDGCPPPPEGLRLNYAPDQGLDES